MAKISKKDLATLLVSCPDRKGLVAALAQLLYGHGVNILAADQHTDAGVCQFFQRIHCDLSEMHGDRRTLEHAIDEVAERFSMRVKLAYGDRRRRVVVLVSKAEHCLHDLLLRHRAGELDCDIPLIIGNHSTLEPVAKAHGIDFHLLPITTGDADSKATQEAALVALLAEHDIDLVVLARYMQILTPEFCARFPDRIINIHHSFLPAFIGGKPYHQAHARGVKIVGATAHYVTQNLDEGPIIEQDVMRVSHRDSVNDLVRKGRDLERLVLSRAVRLHLEDRVLVCGNKTVVFD